MGVIQSFEWILNYSKVVHGNIIAWQSYSQLMVEMMLRNSEHHPATAHCGNEVYYIPSLQK